MFCSPPSPPPRPQLRWCWWETQDPSSQPASICWAHSEHQALCWAQSKQCIKQTEFLLSGRSPLGEAQTKRPRKAFMGAAEKYRSDTWPKPGRIQLTSKLTPEEWAGETMEPLYHLCEVVWFYRASFWDTWLLEKPKNKAWLGQILGTSFGLPLLDKEEFCTSKLVQKVKVHLSPYQHLNCF